MTRKYKPITQEIAREFLDFSEDTGLFKWKKILKGRAKVGDVAGYIRSGKYVHIMLLGRSYPAHRLAWLWVHGVWPEYFIDHINGVKTDNRIENLRDVPVAVNAQNLKVAHKHSQSGYLGVALKRGRFSALIHVDGRNKYLGTFDSPEIAYAAYLEAKRKLHVGCTL